ncbi:MAG: protein kinase [Pirellulaceae bacterium]|nr:protein kinase [Planctomycetales bacterium]
MESGNDYRRIIDGFVKARSLSESQRSDYLKELASESASLSSEVEARLRRYSLLHRHDNQVGSFRYAISRREIGRGRSGVVYEATDSASNRVVAIKLIPYWSLSDTQVERLERSLKKVQELPAGAIVPVLDFGRHEGNFFVVSPLFRKGELGQYASKAPFTPLTAARCVRQLAYAVATAHRAGLVHRDIKPSNILIGDDAQPHLGDFDLARDLNASQQLTQTGAVLGTALYMAPEQTLGQPAEFYTDIYALGAVLYFLLAGRPPHAGSSSPQLFEQIRQCEPVSPSYLNKDVSPELEAICLKCLEKRPQARYTAADDLADELDRWLSGAKTRTRPVTPWMRWRRWAARHPKYIGLMFAILLVVSALSWSLWSSQVESSKRVIAESRQKAAEEIAQAESSKRAATEESLKIARYFTLYSELRDLIESKQVGWKDICRGKIREMVGLKIASTDEIQLRSIAAEVLSGFDLGKKRLVAEGFHAFTVEFSPDGRFLAAGKHYNPESCPVRLYDTSDFSCYREFNVPSPSEARNSGVHALVFSPDSRLLYAGSRDGTIHRFDIAASEHATWSTGDTTRVQSLSITPDGAILGSATDNGLLQLWSTDDLRKLAQLETVGQRIVFNPRNDEMFSARPSIWRYNRDTVIATGATRTIQERSTNGSSFAINKEGTFVAFDHNRRIFLHPSDGGFSQSREFVDPILGKIAHEEQPLCITCTPSSDVLVSCSSDQYYKFWDTATGALQIRKPIFGDANLDASFSPRGNLVALTEKHDVNVYELDTSRVMETRFVSPCEVKSFVYAIDGTRIAAIAMHDEHIESGHAELIVWDEKLQAVVLFRDFVVDQPVTWESCDVTFSSDGTRLYSVDRGKVRAWSMMGGSSDTVDISAERYASIAPGTSAEQAWFTVGDKLLDCHGEVETTESATVQFDNSESRENIGVSALTKVIRRDDRLYVASRDGELRIFNCNESLLLEKQFSIGGHLMSLGVDGVRNVILCGRDDGTAAIVYPESGEIFELAGLHHGWISSISFSAIIPSLVATSGRDGWIHLWILEEQRLRKILTFKSPAKLTPVNKIEFSPTHNRLAASFNGEGGIREWDLDMLCEELGELGISFRDAVERGQNSVSASRLH